MLKKQRNFAETGAASSVLALKEDIGLDFVGNDQLEITPFQRQVFEAEKSRQAREKEKKMEEARGGGNGGRTPNSLNNQSPNSGGDSGLGRSETVRYINEGDGETESDDNEEVLSVID